LGSGLWSFLRQNNEAETSVGDMYSADVYYSPELLARTSTYAFRDDNFGDTTQRVNKAYFGFDKLANPHWNGRDNEVMVKYGTHMLDAIEAVVVPTPQAKADLVAWFHSRSVRVIRGLSVEDRIVVGRSGTRRIHLLAKVKQTLARRTDFYGFAQ
jgi:hypothetical protein